MPKVAIDGVMTLLQILPGTGRGTPAQAGVEGAHAGGVANSLMMNRFVRRWPPSTMSLRATVPLPVPGRSYA